MLQQREISKLLAQAVTHAGSLEHAPDAVLFVSLLSARGLPLITVGSPDAESCISPEALRMYSLMTTNLFKQQPKTGDASLDHWAVLDVDTSLRAVIRKFATTSSGTNEPPTTFYTVLFYSSAYADTQAKVRLDLVTAALTAGLSGYRSS
ncbi:hypothetical protein METBIDRAFT_213583 [Metschnikowia bicuspidata var. bicuspidata NRRL YB-4993]|uniref:Uncharacterized protein n=1 Tax=Metschnikowia bicuspidata var. bicuspidata NRRL YB-4993 TaxID=869754 RepID=A0A1A0H847_9ASCO|nr:hypothetical protein METBIDRAFT_213583 [Metschnikowia bicuspidata var. bicuspidata NRRL YB-4993]OBA20160.1 hypothetical protein METBIDRAFT_213583 [Metschnikowia bicuspidata var. bicuspidata NRRL YB-4993]